MRYLVAAIFVFLAFPCGAWESPCYKGPMPPVPFPRESRSSVMLEARRVVSVEGKIITYDIGGELIIIKAGSFAPLSFLKDVGKGRCTAREPVTIEPEKKGEATGRFIAVTPAPH